MGDKSWVVEEAKACAKVLSKKCIDGEGKDLLPSLSNKGVLDKKEHRRRGRESLTNIFHLLLKHDDDEQGRGASLTSIKHHYKIAYPLSIFGAEKELDKWKQLMARQSSKKGEYFATFLRENLCKVSAMS